MSSEEQHAQVDEVLRRILLGDKASPQNELRMQVEVRLLHALSKDTSTPEPLEDVLEQAVRSVRQTDPDFEPVIRAAGA